MSVATDRTAAPTLASTAPAAFILRYPAPGQRHAGAIDFVSEAIGLRGWVVDIARPGRPVAVAAVCEGVVLATAHAMMDRPDMDRVLGRLTQCGVLIGWSRFDATRLQAVAARTPDATIAVRVAATGELVPWTAAPLTAAAAAASLAAQPDGDRQPRFAEVRDFHEAVESGLFDPDWYGAAYGADVPEGMPLLLDFLRTGEALGRRPNLYFDPVATAAALGLSSPRGALLSYLRGAPFADPRVHAGPTSVHFDEAWYRARHRVTAGTALADFFAHRATRAPNQWFDPAYYEAASEAAGTLDLYADFVSIGFGMGFFPSAALAEAARTGTLSCEAAAYLAALRREGDPAALLPSDGGAAAGGEAGPKREGEAGARVRAAEGAPADLSGRTEEAPPAAPGIAPTLAAGAGAGGAEGASLRDASSPPPTSRVPSSLPTQHASSPPPPPTPREPFQPPSQPPTQPASSPPPTSPAAMPMLCVTSPTWPDVPAPSLASSSAPAPSLEDAGSVLPAAARLGFAGTEAHLAALSPAARKKLVELAAERLAAGRDTADAALLLAVAGAEERPPLAAARAAAAFLAEPPAGGAHTAAEADTETRLVAIAHRLYEARHTGEAEAVFRALFERGRRDDVLVLRLTEAAVDRDDVASAAVTARILAEAGAARTNPWAAIAIARAHLLAGAKADAARCLTALPAYPSTGAIAESVAIHCLINADALDAAAARAERSRHDETPALFAARFRLAVWRQDAADIVAMSAEEGAASLPNWQLGEAMFRLGAPGKLTPAQQNAVMNPLFGLAQTRGLDDNAIVQARLHVLLHQKKWPELAALFEALAGTPAGTNRETQLRKLEYFAHSGQAADADAIYAQTFATGALNKWESLTVLRLLSELKRWEEAGEVLLRHVATGSGFGEARHVAMRVVRRARLHEKVLAAERSLSGVREKELAAFVALVNEDLTILARAVSLGQKATSEGQRPTRYRSNWILGEGGGEGGEDGVLFLCTNQRYFLSALTFLCSFFGQAPQAGCQVFVFLDEDVPRSWQGMFALLGARFNREVELVREAEFVTTTAQHKTDYGFFAGGSNLARAAYFRLYACRFLIERQGVRRAVYVDTDIVCRGDLTPLFETEFGEALVAAAIEDISVEVVNAAGRNALDPSKYFNSGVLAFRMDAPGLRDAIDEAIRVSEEEPHRLSFHDQCALNIAFEGRFVPLAPRFNFYLRPSRERNGYIEDGLLLHFVDKPKPWDIVFDRSYREEWRVWALMLGTFLPQGLYVDVFSAANRD